MRSQAPARAAPHAILAETRKRDVEAEPVLEPYANPWRGGLRSKARPRSLSSLTVFRAWRRQTDGRHENRTLHQPARRSIRMSYRPNCLDQGLAEPVACRRLRRGRGSATTACTRRFRSFQCASLWSDHFDRRAGCLNAAQPEHEKPSANTLLCLRDRSGKGGFPSASLRTGRKRGNVTAFTGFAQSPGANRLPEGASDDRRCACADSHAADRWPRLPVVGGRAGRA
jgi:hypothetical protein